jgi:hypothetical protein
LSGNIDNVLKAKPDPDRHVTLTSGTYISAATTLSSGSAQINIPTGFVCARAKLGHSAPHEG